MKSQTPLELLQSNVSYADYVKLEYAFNRIGLDVENLAEGVTKMEASGTERKVTYGHEDYGVIMTVEDGKYLDKTGEKI